METMLHDPETAIDATKGTTAAVPVATPVQAPAAAPSSRANFTAPAAARHAITMHLFDSTADDVRSASGLEMAIKRLFDLISVVVILALFGWAMVIIAIGIKLSSPGPVVFGHLRVGRMGKPFKCYKFRSMVPNAESVLQDLLARDPQALAEWNRDFKLKDDPRITRIGKFIRKTSLDELPQLWNVINGDMSIVGPRPVVRRELSLYYGHGRRHYLSVRPGLTGLWQVSGRNDIGYEERVELDKRYVQTWSVFSDFMIVMRTVTVMLGKTGAY